MQEPTTATKTTTTISRKFMVVIVTIFILMFLVMALLTVILTVNLMADGPKQNDRGMKKR